MTNDDIQGFEVAFFCLFSAWPNTVGRMDHAHAGSWYKLLRDHELADIEAVFAKLAQTLQWAPCLAQVKEALRIRALGRGDGAGHAERRRALPLAEETAQADGQAARLWQRAVARARAEGANEHEARLAAMRGMLAHVTARCSADAAAPSGRERRQQERARRGREAAWEARGEPQAGGSGPVQGGGRKEALAGLSKPGEPGNRHRREAGRHGRR